MFQEDDLIPLSAIAHMCFCPRRTALIYIENLWRENVATTEGSHLHDKVDQEGKIETRVDLRLVRGLRLRSLRLGLTGKADMVEFHRFANSNSSSGEGWQAFPIEYKRGKLRNEEGYIAQLCAQAMCLEEMLNEPIPEGAIYFGKTRRRLNIAFNKPLRCKTEEIIDQLHTLFRTQKTPQAHVQKKCSFCSMKDLCLPKAMKHHRDASWYLSTALQNSSQEDPPS